MIQVERPNQTLTYPRLATIVASRLVLNAIFRVAYPLIPFVVLRFRVPERTAAWLVTIQVLAGLTSPFGGWLGDHYGHRKTMLGGLAVVLAGTLAAMVAGSISTIIAALGLVGLGTATYQPAMQAYVSDLTPFARRGRALGVVELSWSLAGIVAVPALIALAEWSGDLHLLFGVLAGLLALAAILSIAMLPKVPIDVGRPIRSAGSRRTLLREPGFVGLVLFLWLCMLGQETLFIAQGPWLTARFGATPQDVGNTLFVFGLGELTGVTLATAFTDRLGKVRAVLLGFSLAAALYLILPLRGRTWSSYLPLFGLYGLVFEFAIVSSFSLASSISPTARGRVMSGSYLATQTGRAAGSWFGIRLFESATIVANGIAATALTLIGLFVALIAVRPQENDHESPESQAVRIL